MRADQCWSWRISTSQPVRMSVCCDQPLCFHCKSNTAPWRNNMTKMRFIVPIPDNFLVMCVCPLSNYFAVVIFLFISVCEQTAPAPKSAESIIRYSKKRERKKVEAVKSQESALAGRTWQASWSSILSPYVACQATKLRPVAHTPWRTEIYNTAVLNMAGKQIHMHGKAHGEEGFTTEMLLTWGLLSAVLRWSHEVQISHAAQ